MPDEELDRRAHYWLRHTDGRGRWRERYPQGPPGADLAALRRGAGKEPGTVAAMWPLYTTLTERGDLTDALRAEHVALTLFALHQQSKSRPVHRGGVGLGSAIRELRKAEKYSEEAVDRRFAAAATATTLTELAVHLRGLVGQLKKVEQGLDYTRLVEDLQRWQAPEHVAMVRRRWGGQYFSGTGAPGSDARADSAPEPAEPSDPS